MAPEKTYRRLPLRDLMTDAEKRSRDVAEHVHSTWGAGVTDLRDLSRPADRDWVHAAVRRLLDLAPRTADTPLLRLPLSFDGVEVLLKDESLHPTGSLKHRLAGSLVLYGLVNGQVHEGTTLVEASSGSTAVSEAWVAQLLGLPFVAPPPYLAREARPHRRVRRHLPLRRRPRRGVRRGGPSG